MAPRPQLDCAQAPPAARLPSLEALWRVLASVPDPEIPVVSVVDLGIVRDVAWNGDLATVTVTPTYSGCPATEVIAADIERALRASGVPGVRIVIRLSPAWTTDWMSPETGRKLEAYGIAPPGVRAAPGVATFDIRGLRRSADAIRCPRCRSARTVEISRHGSTPCKAQYRCNDCLEPFDYFKPH
jgi:ring-1,2-phenylacetyl-CoA epoxidase subunit PaaD